MIKTTFDNWIKNPTGSRPMMVQQREMAKQIYTDKYNKMMLRSAGSIKYTLWKSKKGDKFIVFFKIPSESTQKVEYDIVIEFYTKDLIQTQENNLKNYYVRFYSNDPNFTFTFAYVYNKEGLIIPDLKKKLSSKSITEKPKITNPNKMVGWVKGFYFAYIFMNDHGLFNKLTWLNAYTLPVQLNSMINNIMDAQKKLVQVQSLKELQDSKKNPKIPNIGNTDDVGSLAYKAKSVKTAEKQTSIINKISRDISSKSVKRTSTVKYSKRIK
jgi:hypothetical protein